MLATRHVVVDDTGVRQLGGLASELAKQTAERARAQQDVVLAAAQKLNLDQLYELPPLPVGPDEEPADDEPSRPPGRNSRRVRQRLGRRARRRRGPPGRWPGRGPAPARPAPARPAPARPPPRPTLFPRPLTPPPPTARRGGPARRRMLAAASESRIPARSGRRWRSGRPRSGTRDGRRSLVPPDSPPSRSEPMTTRPRPAPPPQAAGDAPVGVEQRRGPPGIGRGDGREGRGLDRDAAPGDARSAGEDEQADRPVLVCSPMNSPNTQKTTAIPPSATTAIRRGPIRG